VQSKKWKVKKERREKALNNGWKGRQTSNLMYQ
jgi:hypothetical protein